MVRRKLGSRAAIALGLWLIFGLFAGCSTGVKLVQDDGNGGIVIYPYRGEDYMVTARRGEAMELMQKRCGGPYTIVREGPARGQTNMIQDATGSEAVIQKRWAVRFKCKSG